MNETPRYASLRDYLRVLREQRLVIVLIGLIAGAVALGVSLRQEPTYESVSAIAFENETQQLALLGGSVSPVTPVEQTPQVRAQTIDEPAVMKRVQRTLDDEIALPALQAAITTSIDEDSFLVDVVARWSSSEFAAELANGFARQATRYTNERTRDGYQGALDDVQSRIDRLGNGLEDQAQQVALADQLTRLRFLVDSAEPARIAETAQPPGAPVSPKTVRNTALGLVLGLLLGIAVAFVRDALDRRLRGTRDIHEELGYPVLGFVRAETMGRALRDSDGFVDNVLADLEGFRIIRQNLEFLAAADQPRKLVVVSSPLPSEGKSTVASSLALAAAAAGRQTLLVECDLRRPALAARLGLRQEPGLTDYLVGQADPQEILQVLPPVLSTHGAVAALENGMPGPAGLDSVPVGQSLTCISAGRMSPQPAELIGSERFATFLQQVAGVYETVILDTSPLLPVADTLEVLPLVDAIVLCVRSNQTTRDQARAARSVLEHYPDRPIGLVVTGIRKRDEPEYAYYSYGYAYRGAPLKDPSAV